MSIVLQVIGWLMIVLGVARGALAVYQATPSGLSLTNPVLLAAAPAVIGIILSGIVFLAFGTVIRLLRQIRDNIDGP